MRLALAAALLVLVAAPAEARHRHHHRYVARCWPGEILLVHEGRCVWAHSRSARDIGRSVPRFAAWPRSPAPPDPPAVPVGKKGDRLKASDPGPGVELPYWEPYPVMGRPAGRWWHI